MIISEKVKISANYNRKYWANKGYEFETYVDARGAVRTKLGSEIDVLVSDLQEGSHAAVDVKCDYCGKEYKTQYKLIIRSRKEVQKDTCYDCQKFKRADVMLYRYDAKSAMHIERFKEKVKQTNIEKYGFENPGQAPEVKEKIKNTVQNKYGVDHVFQSESVKQRIKETNLYKYGCENVMENSEIKQRIVDTNMEKYGCEYFMQTDEYKNKSKQTNIEKYGVEHALQSKTIMSKMQRTIEEKYGVKHIMELDGIKDKIKETNLEKYGVDHYTKTQEYKTRVKNTNLIKYGVEWSLQNDGVRNKITQTLFKNNAVATSKQQRHLCDIFNGELNVPIERFCADIVLPNEMIVIEYDGGGHDLQVKFGNMTHDEFYKKQMNRNYILYRNNYRLVRIISSKDKLLKDEDFIKLLDIAKEYFNHNNRHWVEINIDENKWECSQYTSILDEMLNN